MQKKENGAEDDGEEEDGIEDEDKRALIEEARMPLEQILEKYGIAVRYRREVKVKKRLADGEDEEEEEEQHVAMSTGKAPGRRKTVQSDITNSGTINNGHAAPGQELDSVV